MEQLIGRAAVRGRLVEVLSQGIQELLGEEEEEQERDEEAQDEEAQDEEGENDEEDEEDEQEQEEDEEEGEQKQEEQEQEATAEEKEDNEEVKAAVASLAKHAGPVAAMFVVDSESYLELRNDIKKLPLCVFKRLLASDELQLQSENEVYRLLVHWLNETPQVDGDDMDALFEELAPLLRYHHMTPEFIAGIVAECEWMKDSGLLSSVLMAALGQCNAPPALLAKRDVCRGSCGRGVPPSQARWELQATFELEELGAFETGDSFRINCGYVAGYAAALEVSSDGDDGTFGAYVRIYGGFRKKPLPRAPAPGVGFRARFRFPAFDEELACSGFHQHDIPMYGITNVFGQPWAEVVCEGSPHFPDGKTEVKVTVEPMTAETVWDEDEE